MELKKTINFTELLLYIIISYYIFLMSGALMISIFQGAEINNVSKLLLFLATIIIALVASKLIFKISTKHIHKMSSIKIILSYFLGMILLFVVLILLWEYSEWTDPLP